MKLKFTFLAVILAFCAITSVVAFTPEKENSNYVVIGAFAIKDHAVQFVENAKKYNFKAISEINPKRNLFYVYVLNTGDRRTAFQEANKIRKGTPFYDTWVFTGLLGSIEVSRGIDVNPETQQSIEKIQVQDSPSTVKAEETTLIQPKSETKPQENAAVSSSNETVPSGSRVDSVSSTSLALLGPVEDAEEGSRNFVFKIQTSADQKDMTGEVDIIDSDRTRKVASYHGNQNVVVRPVNKSGNMLLICEVFGYRKITQSMNFNRPLETPGIVEEGNKTIVPFALTRLQKGDIAIMYNVYFFKDAAIMRPESRSEVLTLLAMMKENPKYKIRIHGHTNGKAAGKIISMGESKKFFSLTDTQEGFGSAKKLSEERGNIIREFLVTEGIDASRMEIRAWGGKKPLHDKFSAHAQANVRVEIEILEDK